MIKVTQTQRDNLALAQVMWLEIPENRVSQDLSRRRIERPDVSLANNPPTDSTVADFAGWCTWNTVFRAQGLRSSEFGEPYFVNNPNVSEQDVSEVLFGVRNLLCFRGEHPQDESFGRDSDWQIVMDRMHFFMYDSVVA